MPIATRTAQTDWKGSLASGTGNIEVGTGALGSQEVTWAARTEAPDGKTSPEELCAAAHSSCFSMALALLLGEGGNPPEMLQVSSSVVLDEVDEKPTIVSSAIEVEASVPGLDQAAFDEVIDAAAALCPVSRLFAGAEITVEATLLGS